VKIAQLVASYHPRVGGVEKHVARLAQGCAEAGDDVTVLTHQFGHSPADEWIGAVRVRRFPLTVDSEIYPFSLSLFRHLRTHAADFDLVHVHSYHTLIGHAAIGTGLPLIFTPHYHGTGHTPLRAFLHRLYRPAGARQFKMADAVICVSDAERNLVINDFPGVGGRTGTIPNGTDSKPGIGDDAALVPGRDPVLVTVGRLERYKNVDLIIDAFRALPSPTTLVVVGDGPERSRLKQHARAGEPGWPVLFSGRIPDSALTRLFGQAAVVASASDHEAFGLTLTEGLASGARVVASAIPAHAELARLAGPSAPVSLVDPRDTRKFADLLAESLRAGRVSASDLKLPSWAEVVADTRNLYTQVQSRGHAIDKRSPDMSKPNVPSHAAEATLTETA
jgi:1,2-diacylglycerol 3-alpha-glucosyltransferase